jgi:hypothetical protein
MLLEIDIVMRRSEVFGRKYPSLAELASEAKILLGLISDDIFDGYRGVECSETFNGCYELTIDAYKAAYRYGSDLKKIAGQLFDKDRKKNVCKITHGMLLHKAKELASAQQTRQPYATRNDLGRIAELLLIKADKKPPVDEYVALRKFFIRNCVVPKDKNGCFDKNELQIYKRRLQDAHNNGEISLPIPINGDRRKPGQANIYSEQQLRVAYLRYCRTLGLPPLK